VDLSAKDQIIALNKIDMLPAQEIENIEKQLKKIAGQRKIIAVSGLTRKGMKELLVFLTEHLSTKPIAQPAPQEHDELPIDVQGKGRLLPADDKATARPNSEF